MEVLANELLRGRGSLFGVLAAEALDAACRVHQALFAGEERVAVGADFEADPAFVGGAGLERVAARAVDLNGSVHWMNSGLGHDSGVPFLQSS